MPDQDATDALQTQNNGWIAGIWSALRNAARVSLVLFKILIPVVILVKILQELHVIQYLALPLGPVMELVGLPAELGLVWATAMLNNLYTALVVLAALTADAPITQAQATILCSMMLVAHALPWELRIAQECGARPVFQLVFRVGGAFALGWLLHVAYSQSGLLHGPAQLLLRAEPEALNGGQTLLFWALGEIRNLLYIFLIVTGLMLVVEILRRIRVIDLMERLLKPVLKLMGVRPKASSITVVGLTMGLAYGGGLIIHEAHQGQVDSRDVFFSLSLMGLSHGLIEDTLLMMVGGGHLSGILWGRLLFSLLVIGLLVRLCGLISERACQRFFWRN